MKELKQAFRAVNNPESSAGPKAEVDLPVVELNNRCLKSKKVDLFSSHKKNFIAAIFFFFFLFWHLNIFFRKTRGVFVGSGCGLLRPTPSHDRPWWEGQGAERLQSHSRIWPLTGGLHVGRGRLGHTYTDFTLGPESISSYSGSTMSEAMMPDTVVSSGVGGMYGEKAGGPVDFSYVGIDAILEQMRRKAMKQGFELNIMVVGQSGLGKSTLMNTLFKSKVSRKSVLATAQEKIPKTVEIKSISHDIEEKGVRMKLTVIDTPGFGDQINNENCWQPIMKFINDQYEAYLQEEININRKKRIPDSRVHCCIYFIPPTGHCLRPLDVEFMRRLSKVVNIVPVIAKADTLTLEERDFFKKKIREELQANGIDVYPQKEFDEDAEDRMINEKIREMIPFAVVGSDQEYQVNGRRLLGRKTKWGTIEVENIAHCEFAYLRDLLIRTHMQNIKDITSSIHYEMYRVRRLNENNTAVAHTNGLPEHHLTAHEM
ncbi:septin 9a isoform X6 [Cynoglossus semilaevis]|uniref:septin 9a isoform X6 n=1 Tax=Cynoglossus semilaevis TaxID=244447 RepID=UPI000D62A5E2|nr:neuronal-specific septin-3-like isoform X6 [Cynoglossus semilaevis]